MMNWIAGKWPIGHSAWSSHDGILDIVQHVLLHRGRWFTEVGRTAVTSSESSRHSKNKSDDYVDRWKDATLVIHGQARYRVSLTTGGRRLHACSGRGIPMRSSVLPAKITGC